MNLFGDDAAVGVRDEDKPREELVAVYALLLLEKPPVACCAPTDPRAAQNARRLAEKDVSRLLLALWRLDKTIVDKPDPV